MKPFRVYQAAASKKEGKMTEETSIFSNNHDFVEMGHLTCVEKQTNNDKRKFFEPVADSFDARKVRQKSCEKVDRRFLADTEPESLFSFELFSVETSNSNQLFDLLLFYLDQIEYLKELSEKLLELEAAAGEGNIVQLNLIAQDCALLGANCGMFSLIEPLRRLERIKNKSQLVNAAALTEQVGKEIEGFRLTVKENLERLADQAQINNLAIRS